MILLQDQTVAPITDEERAQRLNGAGAAWNERIAAKPSNGQLTFTVSGRAVGSVAT